MVENYGRSYEFGLATRHYLKHFPMRLPSMAPMGLGMLSKKRMEITPPKRIEGMDQLKAILDPRQRTGGGLMNKYLFYPGCSMETSARAYNESLKAIYKKLGFELEEIKDWNCCGATEYLGINLMPAYALIGRNLALASKQANGTHTVVASCSACYLNLAKADHYMAERPELGKKVNEALAAGGLNYNPGSLEIRHLLDVIINDVGLEEVQKGGQTLERAYVLLHTWVVCCPTRLRETLVRPRIPD